MKYLSHFKFSVPTRFFLVATGVALVIVLSTIGFVQKVHESNVQAAQAAATQKDHAALVKEVADLKDEVKQQEASVTRLNAKADGACNYIKQLDAVRSITASVTVPQICSL